MGLLALRQVFAEAISFCVAVVIARILTPFDFGIYAVCMSVVQLFRLANTSGVGAAIIRKAEEPSETEVRAMFALTLCFSVSAAVLLWVAAPLLPHYYKQLNDGHLWLIRFMALGSLVNSLRVIPESMLEREMGFGKIARVELLESVIFAAANIGFAVSGWGVFGLGAAVLVRDAAATALLYLARPWLPGLSFRWREYRQSVRLALSCQLSTLSDVFRDLSYAVVVGGVTGPLGLGYVNWARGIGNKASMLTWPFLRVSIPWYAKLQNDPQALGAAIRQSVATLGAIFIPLAGLMIGIAPIAVEVVYTAKWVPAVPTFQLFCALVAWASLLPLQMAVQATSSPRVITGLSVLNIGGLWIYLAACVHAWGFLGAGVAVILQLVMMSTAYYFCLVRRGVSLRLTEVLVRPVAHGIATCVSTALIAGYVRPSAAGFVLCGAGSLLAAAALAPLIQWEATCKLVKLFRGWRPSFRSAH